MLSLAKIKSCDKIVSGKYRSETHLINLDNNEAATYKYERYKRNDQFGEVDRSVGTSTINFVSTEKLDWHSQN